MVKSDRKGKNRLDAFRPPARPNPNQRDPELSAGILVAVNGFDREESAIKIEATLRISVDPWW